ncbi:MAG: bifunctional diaminohydroxyphosphoribosylaminopyrimidine deaminase/5-amino-6-(5-phosphoribosylamino)uracil reductase RibD [Ignavibacteriae bacterium]|nr:bifunctional diaminohydroxyphosphoribosylaminopyrimidine deaminase/5-amino-6-(5-phosphoribosylamino)uracil reductase RibD [Ignavibacteriota bacterium]
MTNEQVMARVIELALHGTGKVSPNPPVGCVLVKNGHIIGEGWHNEYGGGHAEVEAISNAIEDVGGATAVVTLEPCSHFGKTPPCADLLIQKGIKRVVIGIEDVNPLVAGNGITKLLNAGVEVEVGTMAEECAWLIRYYIKNITTGMPYVVAKIAQTIDGCIATENRESQWITSEESRRESHALRNELDAVLIGRATALADNPSLSVRNVIGRQPWRIILDTHLSLPITLNVFTDMFRSRTIICCAEHKVNGRKADELRSEGVKIIGVETDENGLINLRVALSRLSDEFRIASVMIEGGSMLFSSLVSRSLIDEYHFFIAPMLFGKGIRTFGEYSAETLASSKKLKIISFRQSGDDLLVVAV